MKLIGNVVAMWLSLAAVTSADPFPAWTYSMKVWPFDILYPDTTPQEIKSSLDTARREGANTIIFYLEEEQMYGSFVDEGGFSQMLGKARKLIGEAHKRGLMTICYVNGLEVMTHDACDDESVTTLARAHPDWLQRDIQGKPMAWTCIENGWITRDMEDAWASPYSGFRDLFKRRIESLAGAGLDAIYIDQASLPGMQDLGDRWASSDAGFAEAFREAYGLTVPKKVDWQSPAWRKFVYFRHEAIREYLADLASTAADLGMAAFFESSSNDTRDGTLLANEPSLSVTGDIAFSPEIEPEGDDVAAFRMAKFARDIRQDLPILYLGWPETSVAARKEFAVAICESGSYYPTADSPRPAGAFAFLDRLRSSILDRRVPYNPIALVYSFRNKDWTYSTNGHFRSYDAMFRTIVSKHLPFRILTLETMTADDLAGIGALVLPGIESISDAEFELLKTHPVVLSGKNGLRDEWYAMRQSPLKFPNVKNIGALTTGLPFAMTAPATTIVEYYRDEENSTKFFLFTFSRNTGGSVRLTSQTDLTVTTQQLDTSSRSYTGKDISIAITDYLIVIEVTAR